jgi:hypothetical protein
MVMMEYLLGAYACHIENFLSMFVTTFLNIFIRLRDMAVQRLRHALTANPEIFTLS